MLIEEKEKSIVYKNTFFLILEMQFYTLFYFM